MLRACMEVFRHEMEKSDNRLILDSYIPADGTYLIIGKNGEQIAAIEIKMDKKTRQIDRSSPYFPDICFYDYHSTLISMNKPMDGGKIIHSNNYLSFFVKKENVVSGTLTEDIIDGYYEVLKNPIEKKYKKAQKASEIYRQFENEAGPVDGISIERNKRWVKEHIFSLNDVNMEGKGYLKIFFQADYELFEREGQRYFLPNIYNSNDYNVNVQGEVVGLPDNNLGMNAKKPFLSIKTRKNPAPYLLNAEAVMFQKKFFDYLMNLASAGLYNVYVDVERKRINAFPNGQIMEQMGAGYYLRIRKGKNEAEILEQDNMPGYCNNLKHGFVFQEILPCDYKMHPEYRDKYQAYHKRTEIGALISEVFFMKCLAGNNYFVDASELNITDEQLKWSILLSRTVIFDWVYKGTDHGFAKMLDIVSLNLIREALLNGYRERAVWQLNLRWSLRQFFSGGGTDMSEIYSIMRENMEKKVLSDKTIPLSNDEEYYYAVGQLAYFLISLNRSKDRPQSLLNPFLNAKSDEIIKRRLLQIYKKYNYDIPQYSRRVRNMLAMVESYIPEGTVNQEMIIVGYASDNIIYTKEEE